MSINRMKEVQSIELSGDKNKSSQNNDEIERVTGEVIDRDHTMDEKEKYSRLCKDISKGLESIENAFISIARNLYNLYHSGLYKQSKQKDIYETAKVLFQMSRGSAHNCISVCRAFGEFDESGDCIGLRKEFADFSPTQLIHMKSMPKELLDRVSNCMTITELKKMNAIYLKLRDTTEELKADTPDTEFGSWNWTLGVGNKKKSKRLRLTLFEATDLEELAVASENIMEVIERALNGRKGLRNLKVSLEFRE